MGINLLLVCLLMLLSQGKESQVPGGVLALDLWTIRGKLSNVSASLGIITQLSRELKQSTTWWQLDDVEWHPEALWRFMVLGAPPPGIIPNASWGKQEANEIRRRGGFTATKGAAVAEYRTELHHYTTGRIKVVSWMLMYKCLTKDCDIAAPVIIAPSRNPGKLQYGTLWQNLFSSSPPNNPVLVSASTADIIGKTISPPGSTKKLQLKVTERLSWCPKSMAMGRSPLDAAYKLPPGICYMLAPKLQKRLNQTRLFVILENQPHGQNWPYEKRPLQECSTAPVVFKNLDEFRTCVFSQVQALYYCANFTLRAYHGICTDLEDIALSNYLLLYSYLKNRTSLPTSFQVVHDTVLGAPCNTSGRTKAAMYSVMDHDFDLSHSIWEDTEGSRTEELEFGRENGSLCHYPLRPEDGQQHFQRCQITQALNASVLRCDTAAVEIDLLDLMFNDTVTSYADEHNTAFNMDRGPANDVFTAWAALVTTAVSVVTATVPCTNLELEYLGRYIYPQKHQKLKLLKFSLLALVNVAFSMVLYTPVFAMILSESGRSQPYYTWSLFTNDVIVNTYGTQLRSVFVVEAESLYQSRILWVFLVVCAISFPLIIFLTVRRCYKVFRRRKLLLKERYSLYGDGPLSKADARELNVKAIEMTLSEYVRLKEQLKYRQVTT